MLDHICRQNRAELSPRQRKRLERANPDDRLSQSRVGDRRGVREISRYR